MAEDVGYVVPDDGTTTTDADYAAANGSIVPGSYEVMPALSFTYERTAPAGNPTLYDASSGQLSAYEQAMAGGQPSAYEQAATAGPLQANGHATGERRGTAWSHPAGQQSLQNAKKKKKKGITVCACVR